MFSSILSGRACAPYLWLAVFAWTVTCASLAWADEDNAAEAKIHKALIGETQFEFLETPLQDVVDYLRDLHKIEIQLDKKALENVGIGPDTPITRNLKDISLRSALRLTLRDLELTYVITDEILLITTPEEAEGRLTTKLYPVADLVNRDPETPYSPDNADFDPLIEIIQATISPEGWDAYGGLGTVAEFAKSGALVVSQTHEVHEKIRWLLASLRRLRGPTGSPIADGGAKALRDKEVVVRVYRVTNIEHLVPKGAKPAIGTKANTLPPDYAAAKRSADALAELIKKSVAPKSWTEPHVIQTIPGTLTIRQSRRVHHEINRLLKKLKLLDGVTTLSPVVGVRIPDDLPVSISVGGRKETVGEARIRSVLGEKTEFELLETPLQDFVDFLRDKHKIEIQLDNKALEDVGIGTDTPLTVNLRGISLRSALRIVLRDLELTYIIRNEVLLITTPEEAETQLTTRIYPVGDLVLNDDDAYDEIDFDPLSELIESTIAPDSWEVNGGPGSIVGLEICRAIVVPQTEEIHEQIAELLQMLRQTKKSQFGSNKQAKKAADASSVLRVYRVAIGVDPFADVAAHDRPNTKSVGDARPANDQVRGQIGSSGGAGGGGGIGPEYQRELRRTKLQGLALLPDEVTADRAMQDLVAMIKGSIEPESWDGEDGGVIFTMTGYLVVRHSARVHRRVRALLFQTDVQDVYPYQGGGGMGNSGSGTGNSGSGFGGGGIF